MKMFQGIKTIMLLNGVKVMKIANDILHIILTFGVSKY